MHRPPRMSSRLTAVTVIVGALLVSLGRAPAQGTPAKPAFSIDDALNVVSYSQTDLSDDGRWLATVSAVRRDGFGVDYRRDGDPTYIRPAAGMVWVIETATGKSRSLFPDKRNVKSLAWSPDGSRLAMLALHNEAFEPVIWERATGRLTTVQPPAGSYVAENSDVRWTNDGNSIVFSLHREAWKKSVREQFDRYTKGPVFVQSSNDPFLAWEDMRRSSSRRSVVAYEVATRKTREFIPEGMISSYTLVAPVAQEHVGRLDRGRPTLRLWKGRPSLRWIANGQRGSTDCRTARGTAR